MLAYPAASAENVQQCLKYNGLGVFLGTPATLDVLLHTVEKHYKLNIILSFLGKEGRPISGRKKSNILFFRNNLDCGK